MVSAVLTDIFTDDPIWNSWSKMALGGVRTAGLAKTNSLIHSDTSFAFISPLDLDRELDSLLRERLQLPRRGEKQTDFGAHCPTNRRG